MRTDSSIVSELQQERMARYKRVIAMATCEEEVKALYKAYEVSRLIHIKDHDIVERCSWLLKEQQ